MEKLVSAHGVVYDHPHKGHDRLYIDEPNAFFGVFDGAGGDELSSKIVDVLQRSLPVLAAMRAKSQDNFLAVTMSGLDNLAAGRRRRSTGAVACVKDAGDNVEVSYFNGGDSSIYFLNGDDDTFTRIAHDPTEFVEVEGRTFIRTEEFLGAGRSIEQIRVKIGQFTLPKADKWSLIGMSDGVQDDDGQGIATASLEEIVRYTDLADVPSQILGAYEPYDDASVFIIQR